MAQRSSALDLRRVVGHGAETVRHHVEEVSDRREPQPIDVQRRRRPIAAAHDHAVAGAGPAVARRTIDVVPLLAARHHASRRRKRKHGRIRAVDLACVEQRVLVQLVARDRAGPPERGPNGRRRKTSIRAAGCTSADRACPAGTRSAPTTDDDDQRRTRGDRRDRRLCGLCGALR